MEKLTDLEKEKVLAAIRWFEIDFEMKSENNEEFEEMKKFYSELRKKLEKIL